MAQRLAAAHIVIRASLGDKGGRYPVVGTQTLTKEEISAFSAKLEKWGTGLSPKERGHLTYLLNAASGVKPVGRDPSDDQLKVLAGGVGGFNI